MTTFSPRQAMKAIESMTDEKKEEGNSTLLSKAEFEKKTEMAGLSLFCDETKENETLANIVDIALLEIDPKSGREVSNHNNKWTIHKSKKHSKIDIIYRKMENEKNITLRSSMDINVSINEIYEFFRCDFNDDLALALEVDKMLQSYNVSKIYDKNRCIVHSAFTTGIPKSLVKPRDFCWMKKRFKYDNYIHESQEWQNNKDNKTDNGSSKKSGVSVAGIFCYSLDNNHPNYVSSLNKHVRGWIHFSGMIFVSKGENICRMYYIVNVDPCGKIPRAIINICAPQQGMNIKHFAHNIDKAKEMLIKRKQSSPL